MIVKIDFNKYLHSKDWAKKKKKAFRSRKYRCDICKIPAKVIDIANMDVYHLHYENIGSENIRNDLIVLCIDCKTQIHDYYESNYLGLDEEDRKTIAAGSRALLVPRLKEMEKKRLQALENQKTVEDIQIKKAERRDLELNIKDKKEPATWLNQVNKRVPKAFKAKPIPKKETKIKEKPNIVSTSKVVIIKKNN